MNKKKTQKRNLFFPIFIPVVAATAISSIVIPAVCLAKQTAHIKMSASNREVWIYDGNQDIATFEFIKADKDINLEYLQTSWSYMISSTRKIEICEILPIEQSQSDPNKFIQKVKFAKVGGGVTELEDNICFQLTFNYTNNDTNEKWQQSFPNLCVRRK